MIEIGKIIEKLFKGKAMGGSDIPRQSNVIDFSWLAEDASKPRRANLLASEYAGLKSKPDLKYHQFPQGELTVEVITMIKTQRESGGYQTILGRPWWASTYTADELKEAGLL